MKSCEELISPESDYFVYAPSQTAQSMFFYPLYCGHFIYKEGYSLHRASYDSFLLMYLEKGSLLVEYEGHRREAREGSFVLIDCYQPHSYSTSQGCQCLWCHFDGPVARAHYTSIVSRMGNMFLFPNPYPVISKLDTIYRTFYEGRVIREPLMSKYLNDVLTAFLLYAPGHSSAPNYPAMAEEIISYISEHFAEDISVEDLACRAGLSQYHFIRTFKKETGFTPHEYLIHTRLNMAKYLLKSSRLPVKDICFNTGFSCESVFCSSFKKRLGLTPVEYRASAES